MLIKVLTKTFINFEQRINKIKNGYFELAKKLYKYENNHQKNYQQIIAR